MGPVSGRVKLSLQAVPTHPQKSPLLNSRLRSGLRFHWYLQCGTDSIGSREPFGFGQSEPTEAGERGNGAQLEDPLWVVGVAYLLP